MDAPLLSWPLVNLAIGAMGAVVSGAVIYGKMSQRLSGIESRMSELESQQVTDTKGVNEKIDAYRHEVREELRGMRTELREDFRDLRAEIKAAMRGDRP